MSGRQNKKMRQAYRRELLERFNKMNFDVKTMIKPAPRWIPERMWFWLQSKFVNLD